MKKLFQRLVALPLLAVLLLGSLGAILAVSPVVAQDATSTFKRDVCSQAPQSPICQTTTVSCTSAQEESTKLECKNTNPIVVTILRGVRLVDIAIGIIAVISIIIGGMRYILSRGDSGQVETAKNTILYAVIGLVIAIAAQLIIAFVLNRIK